MPIQPGEPIPDVAVKSVTADGVTDTTTGALLGEGTIVLFTVPGAFTPTCHLNHLPGYIESAAEFTEAGVDRIVCATANDQHVTKAWSEHSGATGKIEFIADLPAAFAKALGVDRDFSQAAMGTRYARAAFLIRDGIVESVQIENSPGEVSSSGAGEMLALVKGAAA